MSQFIKVAKKYDILDGEVRSFVVDSLVIAICRVNGEFFAIKDECTHMEYPLSDGSLDGEIITCTYHAASFDVRTGDVLSLPAVEPVETFQVKVEGEDIYVLIED